MNQCPHTIPLLISQRSWLVGLGELQLQPDSVQTDLAATEAALRSHEGIEDKQVTEATLEGAWLRRLALDCGADDTGLVEITRPALEPQRDEIFRNYPWTKSLLSFVVRMLCRSRQVGLPGGGKGKSQTRRTEDFGNRRHRRFLSTR